MKGHWALFCFFFLTVLFIYSFLATLGLCCCTGFSLAAELRLLTSVASLVAEHGLSGCGARAQSLQSTGSVVVAHGLSHCGARAQSLWHMGLAACGIFLGKGANLWLLHCIWNLYHSATRKALGFLLKAVHSCGRVSDRRSHDWIYTLARSLSWCLKMVSGRREGTMRAR